MHVHDKDGRLRTPTNMMSPVHSPKYHDLRNDIETGSHPDPGYNDGMKEHDWHDDSTTGEPAPELRTTSRCARFWNRAMCFRSILDTVLLLVIVWLLLDRTERVNKTAEFELAGDITGFAPQCQSRLRSVEYMSRAIC